jgi:competence protein ComEC
MLLCLAAAVSTATAAAAAQGTKRSTQLTVRVLDVGQGDATLIENGGSRVLIDGGPESWRMGQLLDSLGLNDSTFDVVILSHLHADHLVGLRALFESRRHIKVRFFFENQDPYTASNLHALRDSINARVFRGETIYRDTDDPCADGRPVCTITMKGGAKLEIMRPMPTSGNPNNRSTPVKLIGPDSASFSMWFAGDAERDAINWFLNVAHYQRAPGMRVDVLKADHHGSCNGVADAYLAATRPSFATVSVGAENRYGHMQSQAKTIYRKANVPWYRSDENGTIVISSPGTRHGGYAIAVQRGTKNMSGQSDRSSTQKSCKNRSAR